MVAAQYFDGRTTTAHGVTLTLDGEWLQMRGEVLAHEWPLQAIKISERLGDTPRRIVLPDGGHCEVTDHAALDMLLKQGGYRSSWLDGMQHSMRWALLSAVLIIVVFAVAYRYLLPWGAEVVARSIPPNLLQKMGASTLQTLDKLMLEPSKLPPDRQQALRDAYAKLSPLPDAQLDYRIEFRSAPQIGPNAFALPDGNIVMLDELVALTDNDDEIIAVLAHERGHVEQRHALRMVLQSSAVGLVMTWYMGDVSSLLATVPAMLVQASYSRDMEGEADEYAARTLQLNAKSPCLLPDILQKLEAAHAKRQADARKENGDSVMDYLASHPATQDRSALLCPAH
ncbi:MAG: M48 family metallopeptidase [Gammaproteobacteria bacterium]|nr:M48 family metallopeptidase [Gammaproteobacteria bacterium]MBU1623687.1 M48 family metallopeptidase [Gammaproteobacteria bacterium]